MILKSLGNLAIRIEHIGSTSVRGMSAKPIIDMDVVINDRKDLNDVILSLANTGYVYEGDLGIADREAFAYKGEAELPEHHLYVCPEDSPELRKHTAFRDYLRTNPDAAREYSRIKEKEQTCTLMILRSIYSTSLLISKRYMLNLNCPEWSTFRRAHQRLWLFCLPHAAGFFISRKVFQKQS